ncbi:SH3 domain-containing protein [Arenimonas alkanexedens]
MSHPTPSRDPRPRTLALALAVALASGFAFAESGTVLKPTELREQPQASASVVAKLSAQQTVEITERKGAWIGLKTSVGEEGWARILNLRTGGGSAGNHVDQMAAFRTGATGSSVSTGIKGLSADQLMSASANNADLALLDQYAATNSEANGFAAEVPLTTNEVAYLKQDRGSRRRNR